MRLWSYRESTHLEQIRVNHVGRHPVIWLLYGVWRSWLARTAGGREVAGSSPVTPTMYYKTDGFYEATEIQSSISRANTGR